MENEKIWNRFSLTTAAFLAIMMDFMIMPFSGIPADSAKQLIYTAVLAGIAVIMVFTLVLNTTGKRAFRSLLSGCTVLSRIFAFIWCILLPVTAAELIVRSERFFRYVNDTPIPTALFYLAALTGLLYALHCEKAGIIRTVSFATLFIIISVCGMLFLCRGRMRAHNLSPDMPEISSVLRLLAEHPLFCPELPALLLSAGSDAEKAKRNFRNLVIAAVSVCSILSAAAEAAYGPQVFHRLQPFYLLACAERLSVFRHLESVHAAVWLFAQLCRIGFLTTLLRDMLSVLLQGKCRKTGCAAVLLIALSLVPVSCMNAAAKTGFTHGTMLVILGIAVSDGIFGEGKKTETKS